MDEPSPNPMPEDLANFLKKIRNISVRYLNGQKPTKNDLEQWILLPLYQPRQDTILENEKTDILVANVNTIRHLVMEYDKRIERDQEEEEERMKKGNINTSHSTSYSYSTVEKIHQETKNQVQSSDDDEENDYGKRARKDDYGHEKDTVFSSSKESLQLSSLMSMDGIDDLISLQEFYNDDDSE